MKFYICLFILICSIESYSKDYLTLVENTIKKEDYYLIETIGNQFLSIANDEEIKSLHRNNIKYLIIDENPQDKIYYKIYPISLTERDFISTIGDILYKNNECVLVRVLPHNKDRLFDLRGHLEPVGFDKLSFESVILPHMKNLKITYNPLIQAMVDDISKDSLRAYVTHLQDIPSRHVNYKYMTEQVVPYIGDKLREYGCDSVFTQTVSGYKAPNIIGIKLGKKYPSTTCYVLIGGHPDAMPRKDPNYGADDNASGTAAYLEAARVMNKYNFEYTIVYMGFNAEEVGLVGSKVYAKEAKSRGDTILGVINLDMIGHTESKEQLRVSCDPKVKGCVELGAIYEKTVPLYSKLDFAVDHDADGRSDHKSFWDVGYPALKNIEMEKSSKVYHTLNDYIGHKDGLNNMEYFLKVVQGATATIATIATVEDATPILNNFTTKTKINELFIQRLSNKKFKITLNQEKENLISTISIFNSIGKIIYSQALSNKKNNNTITWDAKNSAGGIYFIEVRNKKSSRVQRIVF